MSGALFWEDLVTLAIEAGFCRPVLYSSESMVVKNERVQAKLPGSNCDVTKFAFTSLLFKDIS